MYRGNYGKEPQLQLKVALTKIGEALGEDGWSLPWPSGCGSVD